MDFMNQYLKYGKDQMVRQDKQSSSPRCNIVGLFYNKKIGQNVMPSIFLGFGKEMKKNDIICVGNGQPP
jgi:hypothetical protein